MVAIGLFASVFLIFLFVGIFFAVVFCIIKKYEVHMKEVQEEEKTHRGGIAYGRIEGRYELTRHKDKKQQPIQRVMEISYQVGEHNYQDYTLIFTEAIWNLPEGATVTVCYNEMDPRDFALEGNDEWK